MKKIILFGFLLLFLFSPNLIFAANSPTISLSQLTFSDSREDWPMIHKDSVYWLDPRGGIWGYDFNEQTEFRLFEGDFPLTNFFAPIGIDDNYLIYISFSEDKSYDVRAYDFNKEKDIAVTDAAGSQTVTDYDNNTLVYIDGYACGKLYTYDLKKEETTFITNDSCGPARISNNIVVWGYAAPNGSNVYGYDLSKNQQFDIATEDGYQESPDIYGNNVIYLNSDGTSNSVSLKNLRTGEVKTLNETSGYSMSWPSISRRYVVWGKNTAQHISGVEGVDLKTGVVFEIQEQGQHQNDNLSPIINGNIAAWMAWRTGNGDIYAAIIDKN